MIKRLEHSSCKKKLRKLDVFSLKESSWEGNSPMSVSICREVPRGWTRLCTVVLGNRKRGKGQKLMCRKFYLNMRKNLFSENVITLFSRLPREDVDSPSGMDSPLLEILENHLDTILYNAL